MGKLKTDFIPVSQYNQLPLIHDMEHIAETYADDLNYLTALLDKHNLPRSVCVKLIHIHFHLDEGEIVALRELDATPYKIPFLSPTPLVNASSQVRGCHFLVDSSGDLQAFEYTTRTDGLDIAAHPAFVDEFCAAVVQRNLQDKFGLVVMAGEAGRGSWTELEFPEKRATFLLPASVALPQSPLWETRTTYTQFLSPKHRNRPGTSYQHTEYTHTVDADGDQPSNDKPPYVPGVTTKGGLSLSGVSLDPSSKFYSVVSAISVAA
jgi:hypothetical protein